MPKKRDPSLNNTTSAIIAKMKELDSDGMKRLDGTVSFQTFLQRMVKEGKCSHANYSAISNRHFNH